jgi:hypothetical protein
MHVPIHTADSVRSTGPPRHHLASFRLDTRKRPSSPDVTAGTTIARNPERIHASITNNMADLASRHSVC